MAAEVVFDSPSIVPNIVGRTAIMAFPAQE